MRLQHGLPPKIRNKRNWFNMDDIHLKQYKLAFVDLREVTINPYDYMNKSTSCHIFTKTLRNINVPLTYADRNDDSDCDSDLHGIRKRNRKLSNQSYDSDDDNYHIEYFDGKFETYERKSPRKAINHVTYNLDGDDDSYEEPKKKKIKERRPVKKRRINRRTKYSDSEGSTDESDDEILNIRRSPRKVVQKEAVNDKRMLRKLCNVSYANNDADIDDKNDSDIDDKNDSDIDDKNDSDYEVQLDEIKSNKKDDKSINIDKTLKQKQTEATENSSDEETEDAVNEEKTATDDEECELSMETPLRPTRAAGLKRKLNKIYARVHVK